MDAGKTLGWAGATPELTAFSRPKFFGVAPAHHARGRDRVLPACKSRRKQSVMRSIVHSEVEKEEDTWQF